MFLALLALARHRLETDAGSVPVGARAPLAEFDRGVRETLEAVADALEGKAAAAFPDLRGALESLARTESELSSAPSSRVDAPTLTHLHHEVTIRRYVLGHVDRLCIPASTNLLSFPCGNRRCPRSVRTRSARKGVTQ